MRTVTASPPAPIQLPSGLKRPDVWLGLLIGAMCPLAAALLYHPYTLSMASWPVELTRQLGLPFVAGEIGLIVYARRAGLDLADLLRRIGKPTQCALAIFIATFWISSVAVSRHAPFSTCLALIWVIHLYAGAAAFHLARTGRIGATGLAAGLAIGLTALAPTIWFHLSLPPQGFGAETWRFGAPVPGFISVRLFGAWAGGGAVLLLGLAWRAERDGERVGWTYLALGLAAGMAAWTGTRAALVAAVVAIAAAAWAGRGAGPLRFWLRALGAVLAGWALMTLVMPPPQAGALVRADAFGSADGFFSGRLTLWSNTLAVAVQRPLFGHGMGANWWLVSVNGMSHVQPHNALVEFFINWGLIATIAALWLLAAATWHAHKAAGRAPALLPAVMAIDYLLAASMFDGMLHFSEFLMLLTALFGICLGTVASADPAGRRVFLS